MKKILVALFALFFVGTAFCDEPEKPNNEALIQAITSFNWSWESCFDGPKTFSDIQFFQGGLVQNPRYFTARWQVVGPRTLMITYTKGGSDNEGNIAYVVFDANFTRYIGMHFDGKTLIEGSRRESLDPNRVAPNLEDK